MMLSDGVLIALISGAAAIIAAVVSFLTSKHIAGKEIKKMKMGWDYQEKREREKDFAEMLTVVKIYCDAKNDWNRHRNAIGKINLCRAKATGKVAELLNDLYAEISVAGTRSPDTDKIQSLLDSLVDARKSE